MEIDVADILEEQGVDRRSISPVVFESDVDGHGRALAEATKGLHRRDRRRLLKHVVMGVMGFCTVLLAVAAVRPHEDPAPARRAASPAPEAAPAAVTASVDPTPWTTVNAAPAPTTGKVAAAATRAGVATIDGMRLTASGMTLACGRHSLRVGRGAARDVVVPCGGTLILERDGSVTVH
jgi:hypothetical protein